MRSEVRENLLHDVFAFMERAELPLHEMYEMQRADWSRWASDAGVDLRSNAFRDAVLMVYSLLISIALSVETDGDEERPPGETLRAALLTLVVGIFFPDYEAANMEGGGSA